MAAPLPVIPVSPAPVPDDELVRRVVGGDVESYRTLVERHYPACLRFAIRMLGDRQDAEEAVQNAFVRVYRALDRYDARSRFEAWLFRIPANLVVDRIREAGRERVEGDPVALELKDEESPEESAVASERRETVARMLERLPAEQKEVLLLRFAGGLDTNEAGAVMGKMANAVRQLQFRGLQGLREMIRTGAAI